MAYRQIALRVAAFSLLSAVSLQATAEPLTLYLYKEGGMSVYSNRKPKNVEYTVVHPGSGLPRPVLSIPPPVYAEDVSSSQAKVSQSVPPVVEKVLPAAPPAVVNVPAGAPAVAVNIPPSVLPVPVKAPPTAPPTAPPVVASVPADVAPVVAKNPVGVRPDVTDAPQILPPVAAKVPPSAPVAVANVAPAVVNVLPNVPPASANISSSAAPIEVNVPTGTADIAFSAPPITADIPKIESAEVLIGWAASCKGVSKEQLDQRAVQWQELVDKHAKTHGVPAALVRAVMRVESCFDRNAVSRVGARGLMQLMPETAAELGVRDSFDADQNIDGGARYLRFLLARFKNNTRLAVAAYNAGPNAVDTYRGIPPFPETRSYVERVIAEYRVQSSAKPKQSKS